MTTLGIAEILDQANRAEPKEAKINVLRDNICQPLLDILLAAYDDRVKWLLPAGLVPYKPGPETGAEGRLKTETKKLYYYIEGGGSAIDQLKRETMFIQLLESLDPADARLVSGLKDKRLPYRTLTRDLINEAFPNFLEYEGREEIVVPLNVPETAGAEQAVKENKLAKRVRGRPRLPKAAKKKAQKSNRGRDG